jgi:hypothetical protein
LLDHYPTSMIGNDLAPEVRAGRGSATGAYAC